MDVNVTSFEPLELRFSPQVFPRFKVGGFGATFGGFDLRLTPCSLELCSNFARILVTDRSSLIFLRSLDVGLKDSSVQELSLIFLQS